MNELEGVVMKQTKYPKIGSTTRIPPHITKRRGICKCGVKADYRVDVQWGWMRGDDTVHKACAEHKNDLVFLTGA